MPIKEVIKEKFNTGTIKPEHIITSVSEYKSVSFDVFDTLLKRNVQKPTDVFRVLEHSNPSLEGFAEARIKAEEKARKKSTYEEVTLDEIYVELRNDGFLAAVSPADELNAEAELLTVNQPIKEVYDYFLSSGKDIYIISDSYLPRDFICSILERLGYTDYKKLYVSSEWRKTKSIGSLYGLVLSENNINPSDLIHIGDSIKSDYVVPKKKGISAIHIPSNITGRTGYKHEAESLQMACMKAFIDNTISSDGDSYYHFGYECFGPFLWGFSHWLIKNCEEQNINRIFFFSRDGWIMKRAFDFVNKDASLMSVYLEVSRRSLRIPTLWMDLEFDSVIKMIGAKLIPLVSIFDGVGLDINYYGELIKKYGFDKETVFDRKDALNNTNLRALFEELKPDIISVSKREYETLKGYIEQNNLSGKFAIVDIGWSGSMQRYLVQTLGKIGINCDIYGYYTGVAAFYTRNTDAAPDMKMKGYLFDFMNDKNSHDVRSCFVGLFESIFLERGGSVKNYAYAAEQPGGVLVMPCVMITSTLLVASHPQKCYAYSGYRKLRLSS